MNKLQFFLVYLVVVTLALFGLYHNLLGNTEVLDNGKKILKETTDISGEIIDGIVIEQSFFRPYSEIHSLEYQFANFSNRENKGEIFIEIYNNDKLVGHLTKDAGSIGDGEFVSVQLVDPAGKVGDIIKTRIFSENSENGKAVTVWINENELMQKLNSSLLINGLENEKSMNIRIRYVTPKINKIWWSYLLFVIWGTYYFVDQVRKWINAFTSKYKFEITLVIVGFIILALRDLSFVSEPLIYAEDGSYLSDIIKKGFWEAALSNRNGLTNEFKNFGSYALLYISWLENKIFNGFNISNLPVFIGVTGNLFVVLTGLMLYNGLKHVNKYLAFVSFVIVLIMPLGNSQPEVMGRILNMVFIYPVLCFAILLRRYDRHLTVKNSFLMRILEFIAVLICGMTFPISFVVLAIYLGFIFLKYQFNIKRYIIEEIELLIVLAIGFILLPNMIGSEGITVGMSVKKESLIEFILIRHFIYPLIYPIYSFLNDYVSVMIFVIYNGIAFYAYYLSVKTEKKYFNNSIFIYIMTVAVCFSSAIMRLPMSTFFSNYNSTYPDRYYYGCNILGVILFLHSVFVIGKYSPPKIYPEVAKFIITLIMILFLANPYLLQFTNADLKIIKGKENRGDFKASIIHNYQTTDVYTEKNIEIIVYPVFEGGTWGVDFPVDTVITTAIE